MKKQVPFLNVTTNSNNLFVNFRWTLTFALRNRMTERTSHLAGLWIGAAVSNTSHSNKAGSTTVKEYGSQVKDQGRRHCCHNEHKNVPIGLHVIYLYFHDTPRSTHQILTQTREHVSKLRIKQGNRNREQVTCDLQKI
jgi:hypothetical protein